MPSIYNVKGRATQWINSIVSGHDCWCGCDKPFFHLFYLLQKQEGFNQLTAQEEKDIKKCLTSTTTTTADVGTATDQENGGPEGDLDFGDLDQLFAEDGPGEDAQG